ncbi:competence/damage-inducible protein A [Haloplanus salinus]|jgi:molybdenum cofactor synthesis domain-containing protein|uniref:Competence/damage-inducible protein A n=1 Tax=Haloplanus salinus TaxID=1126245 RepID=A0A368NAA1_9EURY|nr:molybdopterin-binding protein [Haloplanus salinus]RCU46495.1 competence/damage-inducible protein A [Haloplanus salinus]
MRVAVVTVGDELLSGDTVDTNASWLCDRLDERGVSVERITTVPDRVADIARVVNEYHAEYDAVIVTGGVGPTHDDVTMDGVAAAFGREMVPNADAEAWIAECGDYAVADLTEGTTHLPAGARMLPNPEGVAPGAAVESVYVMPGVPTEMKGMFETVAAEFEGEPTHVEVVRTSEPESALLDRIGAVREEFDVTVGSYPGEDVRLKVMAADAETAAAAAAWLRERVDP